MILYSALKYTILYICIDNLFKSIYKNIKPNLLLSTTGTISLVEGMYFDRIECHAGQHTEKTYGVRICQLSYNKARITADILELYRDGSRNRVAWEQNTGYTIRFHAYQKIDFYINGQHFYMIPKPISFDQKYIP